jgi:hypothetical protein
MSKDIECPYCGHQQDVCHDDGFAYEEDKAHEEVCGGCDKNFVFFTTIMFSYDGRKADCLNDGEHKLTPSRTIPKWATHMSCSDCDFERPPTDAEREKHGIPIYNSEVD